MKLFKGTFFALSLLVAPVVRTEEATESVSRLSQAISAVKGSFSKTKTYAANNFNRIVDAAKAIERPELNVKNAAMAGSAAVVAGVLYTNAFGARDAVKTVAQKAKQVAIAAKNWVVANPVKTSAVVVTAIATGVAYKQGYVAMAFDKISDLLNKTEATAQETQVQETQVQETQVQE